MPLQPGSDSHPGSSENFISSQAALFVAEFFSFREVDSLPDLLQECPVSLNNEGAEWDNGITQGWGSRAFAHSQGSRSSFGVWVTEPAQGTATLGLWWCHFCLSCCHYTRFVVYKYFIDVWRLIWELTSPPEVSKGRLDGALREMERWKVSLPMQGIGIG